MSSTVYVATVGASDATNGSLQKKIVFDGTRYWAFYKKTASWLTVYYRYSTDLITWSAEQSFAFNGTDIPGVVATTGGSLYAFFDSGVNRFLITNVDTTAGNNVIAYAMGTPAAGPTITWTHGKWLTSNTGWLAGFNVFEDSAGKICTVLPDATGTGNAETWRSANAFSTSWADDAQASTILVVGPYTQGGNSQKIFSAALAGGNLLMLHTDQTSLHSLDWTQWTGAAWSVEAAIVTGIPNETDWGAVALSTSSIFMLARTAASTFTLYSWNGTTMTSASIAAPPWPTSGLATNSQVALLTDGINVWAGVIRGDANTTASFCKYNVAGNSWDGAWTDIDSSAKVRSYIAPALVASGNPYFHWTQINGADFDLAVSSFTGPSITGQPNNATVNEFSAATFTLTASATGGGSLTEQWQVNKQDGTGFHNVTLGSGGTSTSFSTANTNNNEAQNGFQYSCAVTETGGTNDGTNTTNTVLLTVNNEPKIATFDARQFPKPILAQRAQGLI